MEKWRNRIISAVVIAALVAGATGCSKKDNNSGSDNSDSAESTIKVSGNFNPTGLPIMKQPITLKFLAGRGGVTNASYQDKAFYKKMSEETNVNIEWNEVAGSAMNETLALAISSNDMPDALYAEGMPNYADAIDGGLILPLDDYINKFAPNEKRILEMYPQVKMSATYSGDGKIYYYSGVGNKPEAALRAPLFINKVWLENLGLKVPTTLDEYYTVLKAFKEKDPNRNGQQDEIPVLFDRSNGTYEDFLAVWGIVETKTRFHTTVKDGKLIFNPTDIRYKDALSYLNRLYTEELLDREIIAGGANPRNKIVSKGSNKPAILGSFSGFDLEMTIGTPNVGEYEAILPLKGPNGERIWPYNPSELGGYPGLTVFKDCKYPEAAIRWVDHLNDGVNAITSAFGPENVSWKRDEATKTWWTLDEELAKKGTAINVIKNAEATQNGPDMSKITEVTGYQFKAIENSRDWQKLKWTEMYRPYFNKEYWGSGMPISKSTDESKEVDSLVAEFDTYLDAFVLDIIKNGQADQKWEAHMKKCKDLQTEKVVKYYQQKFDELQKLMKK